ncbi:hypothetical protein H0H81_001635 [Sphagnurus paluster]|uniref:G domain-containing protein n=1 Tax=Sphagnurus paluster TaxID=117069 RepID=A0A9P7GMZ1_9AGAR|nr:hypothetical protein H0H81_001635 [Sphagnurus paluster]
MSATDTMIQVSTVILQDKKKIDNPQVFIDGHRVTAQWETDPKTGNNRAIFSPSLPLGPSQKLSYIQFFVVEYHQKDQTTEVTVVFRAQDRHAEQGAFFEPSIAPTEDTLRPSTEDILRICPRYSGVGKSSLINQAFGVNAKVEHGTRGISDIDEELISKLNDRFILHDSMGFEAGDDTNFKRVDDFIINRNKKRDIKDKLHAVWLCFQVPTAGGRVLETADEHFLKAKAHQENTLGGVPIIAVFTQYDRLVSSIKFRHLRENKDSPPLEQEAAEQRAEELFGEFCTRPLRDLVNEEDVPSLKVSTQKGYESTIDELIKLTQDRVEEYVSEIAGVVAGIAQRASPSQKIETSIQVGKKSRWMLELITSQLLTPSQEYWTGLATGVHFGGKTLEQIFRVLHTDIVAVWNFYDPHKHLYSQEFREIIYKLVDTEATPKPDNSLSTKVLSGGMSLVGALAGILSALSGPAAPIVLPIMATVVLGVWLTVVYNQSRASLQRLMSYIIQLILIMQIIFWLRVTLKLEDSCETSRRLVKLACKLHIESSADDQLRKKIEEYAEKANLSNSKAALEKTTQLINEFRLQSEKEIDPVLLQKFDPSAEDDNWD